MKRKNEGLSVSLDIKYEQYEQIVRLNKTFDNKKNRKTIAESTSPPLLRPVLTQLTHEKVRLWFSSSDLLILFKLHSN